MRCSMGAVAHPHGGWKPADRREKVSMLAITRRQALEI